MRLEAFHPGELVWVLVGADGIAIGQVDGGDTHRRLPTGNRLDIARLRVRRIARQASAHILDRGLGENRDAVIGLLAVRCALVTLFDEGEGGNSVRRLCALLRP